MKARGAAVTADDWGLSPGVNEGILRLAERGIVTRVSALATAAYLGTGLDRLLEVPGIEIGLHFNITDGSPLAPFDDAGPLTGPDGLFRRSPRQFLALLVGRVPADALRQELRHQLRRIRGEGVSPAYLDGHHHAHLFPGVLRAISSLLKEEGITALRIPYDPALWLTRRAGVNLVALAGRRRARREGFRFRPCFYPGPAWFRGNGEALLARLETQVDTEVIVHPAAWNDLEGLDLPDSYRPERVREFETLSLSGTRREGGLSASNGAAGT